MTEEEKRAAIAFFGTLHAQANQTDNNIVGTAGHVGRISPAIKQQFEQVLHAPTARNNHYEQRGPIEPFAPPPQQPIEIAPIRTPEPLQFQVSQQEPVTGSIVIELSEIKQTLKDILDVHSKLVDIISKISIDSPQKEDIIILNEEFIDS
jgi:hypothetical protein